MARTLHRRTALPTQRGEIRYTLGQLRAHPLGAPHVAVFEGLRAECIEVHEADLCLLEDQADAQARVDVTDDKLNEMATRFSRALLTLTGNNRSSPTYRYYFGSKPLAAFKKRTLGGKLKEMAAWIPSLPGAAPSLQAMGPELIAAVAAGQQAENAKEDVARQRRELRDIGPRRQLIDRLNAVRKEVHGALARLPHEHLHLPTNFADQFFRRDHSRPEREDDSGVETVESARAHLEALRADVVATEERIAELLAEAEAEEQAARARAKQEEVVADFDRALAELLAKRAAAIAELDAG